MMNKYILLLGVAGVALGSYAAYAGNSATMTVTATIAHDVSLSVTQDIDLGTITINPAYTGSDTAWEYSASGELDLSSDIIESATSPITVGMFTANIPNPPACNGLSLSNDGTIFLFGGNNGCDFVITYSGSGNTFKVYPSYCVINNVSTVTTGPHEGTLTISYTAS
ncbi:MAG: hypothetical protein IJ529_02780 [Alphaproteobacteria bacterium]|nr:hypothetical protein [Alphaproteobacteria bacterium]